MPQKSRQLPSLNALYAFEAAARQLSFTRAADELHVTRAAISYQVKVLEQHLGVRLFRRLTRNLKLTAEGRTLLSATRDALDRVGEAVQALRGDVAAPRLVVSVTPGFGVKWLAHQHLTRFLRQHPEIEFHLHHSDKLVDFSKDEADMAVRWGRGNWQGLNADFLMRAALTPVCSPRLLEGVHPLRKPKDLKHHTLLHEHGYEDWVQWLAAAGVKSVNPRYGPIIDNPTVALQSVIEGQGVKLDRAALISEEIAAGKLVQPFQLSIQTDLAYYIVYPPQALTKPKVRAFRDFLLAEVAARSSDFHPAAARADSIASSAKGHA